MKPHFGQSDAAMNKLAGCNVLPNANKPAEKDFDPVKERDAAYDLGYKDAQKQQGYYGHQNGCDCAVCEDMHNREIQQKVIDVEWNKLLDDNAGLIEQVEKWKTWYESVSESAERYRIALEIIVNIGSNCTAFRFVNVANEALGFARKNL